MIRPAIAFAAAMLCVACTPAYARDTADPWARLPGPLALSIGGDPVSAVEPQASHADRTGKETF